MATINEIKPPTLRDELPFLYGALKAQYKAIPRYYEMSHETLYEIERRVNLIPRSEPCSTLWGVEIRFNEALPLNEIKPIY